MNDAIFIGVQNLDAPQLPSVSVFRPSPAYGRGLVKWVIVGLAVGALMATAAGFGLMGATLVRVGAFTVAGLAAGTAALYFRNTKLFVTEEHFGSTNLFGEMRLIPRKLLASIEADGDFRFQSADGVTLLLARPSVWTTSQIRQLSNRLGVPFEVFVRR